MLIDGQIKNVIVFFNVIVEILRIIIPLKKVGSSGFRFGFLPYVSFKTPIDKSPSLVRYSSGDTF